MLAPASSQKLHFRLPGLFQDGRNVVVGKEAVVLLLSLDRTVSFLRLLSDEPSLSDLLLSVRMEVAKNALGASLYWVRLATSDSLLLDRLARLGRLSGASLFVGQDKRFVAYRDEHAPFGYDLVSSLPDTDDLVLFSREHEVVCQKTRTLSLSELLQRLELVARPGGVWAQLFDEELRNENVFVSAAPGLCERLVRYLLCCGQQGELFVPVPPSPNTLDSERSIRDPFLRLSAPNRVILSRLLTLPSVRLFRQEGSRFLVEMGYAHPFRLLSLESLFSHDDWFLFFAHKRGPFRAHEPSRFPLSRLFAAKVDAQETGHNADASHHSEPPTFFQKTASPPLVKKLPQKTLTLRLVPRGLNTPWRVPSGVLLPWKKHNTLKKLLGVLSSDALSALSCVEVPGGLFCFGNQDVLHLGMGTLFCEAASHVYVNEAFRLVPELEPELLLHMLVASSSPSPNLVVEPTLFLLDGSHPVPLQIPLANARPFVSCMLAPLSPERVSVEPRDPKTPTLLQKPLSFFASHFPLFGLRRDPEKT